MHVDTISDLTFISQSWEFRLKAGTGVSQLFDSAYRITTSIRTEDFDNHLAFSGVVQRLNKDRVYSPSLECPNLSFASKAMNSLPSGRICPVWLYRG